MTVYVGKDVQIAIQIPMEEDVSSQANGSNTVFTVSKTPISDRDQDGVANEPEHVAVYVNDVEVAVNTVNDASGQITLASAPSQGSRVIIEYRYDSTPYIAQELTISPRQTVEGVDGLGSDIIQQWALLDKSVEGIVKEIFKLGSRLQLDRVLEAKRKSLYTQQFWSSAALDDFQGDTGSFTVDTQELLVSNNNSSWIGVKDSVLPIFRDGLIKCRVKGTAGDRGWIFRWDGTLNNAYRVQLEGSTQLRIYRIKNGGTTQLLLVSSLNLPNEFIPVEVKFTENRITVDVNGKTFSVVDPDPLLIKGMPGFYAYYAQNDRFDDFQVWTETVPHEYGMIVKWDQAGSAVKIGLDRVVFPEGSIPSPKNNPVFIVTPFKAVTAKTIA